METVQSATFGDLPCVAVEVNAGRSVVREFDFTRDGKSVHVKRQALQVSFNDAWGYPNIGVVVPVYGFELDIKRFERMPLTVYAASFELDNSGVCVFKACGFVPVKVK